MTSSVADMLVPTCVHSYRYSTLVFTVGGPFSSRSLLGESLIAYRCAFIGATYGILNTHFIFRFMILKHGYYLHQYFLPYGLLASMSLVFLHIFIWGYGADNGYSSEGEFREYVRESLELAIGNIDNVNIKGAVFSEASPDLIFQSWVGTIVVTFLATYSITLYLVLGYKIMSSLNEGIVTMSHKTNQMQKRLFWALTVQTVIPICVSFMPCTLVLYGSALKIDFPNWVNWMSAIAISTFPVFDPLAITLCLPALRCRLLRKIGINLPPASSNQIHTM